MEEEEIILKQADLINKAADLIKNRITQLEPSNEEKKNWDVLRSEVEGALRIFKTRSLKLHADTLHYLSAEIIKPDSKLYYFLLPNVRTLLDIYARFLHLKRNCLTESDEVLTCISYQLLTYRELDTDLAYEKTLSIYKNFLQEVNFSFPNKPSEMDFDWVRRKKLSFQSRSKILTEENIKNHSTYAKELFGSKKTSKIYGYLSEHLHGNPYYYIETQHNERFLVISMAISTTAFLIELVDKYTLNKIQPRDFRLWLNEVKTNRKDFMSLWKNKQYKTI